MLIGCRSAADLLDGGHTAEAGLFVELDLGFSVGFQNEALALFDLGQFHLDVLGREHRDQAFIGG